MFNIMVFIFAVLSTCGTLVQAKTMSNWSELNPKKFHLKINDNNRLKELIHCPLYKALSENQSASGSRFILSELLFRAIIWN